MQSFVITLLTCSVTMSALALFYMALTPFLSKRYSEKGRYYAWLIVIIEAYWFDEAGTANLTVVRSSTGQITAIESISEEKAREYHSAADEYEQNVLNGLDEKIAERMKGLYPES